MSYYFNDHIHNQYDNQYGLGTFSFVCWSRKVFCKVPLQVFSPVFYYIASFLVIYGILYIFLHYCFASYVFLGMSLTSFMVSFVLQNCFLIQEEDSVLCLVIFLLFSLFYSHQLTKPLHSKDLIHNSVDLSPLCSFLFSYSNSLHK